jgi:hypothetical protein
VTIPLKELTLFSSRTSRRILWVENTYTIVKASGVLRIAGRQLPGVRVININIGISRQNVKYELCRAKHRPPPKSENHDTFIFWDLATDLDSIVLATLEPLGTHNLWWTIFNCSCTWVSFPATSYSRVPLVETTDLFAFFSAVHSMTGRYSLFKIRLRLNRDLTTNLMTSTAWNRRHQEKPHLQIVHIFLTFVHNFDIP